MDEKYMLVKGRAGLGNRLLSLLTAMLYARLSERRLLVDWTDEMYSEDGANVFYQFFRCRCSSLEDEIPSTDSVRPRIWRGNLHRSAREMVNRYVPDTQKGPETWKQFSIDLSKLHYPEQVTVMWSYYDLVHTLRPHLKGTELYGADTRTILKTVFETNLTPHPNIQERVDCFKAQWSSPNMVGLHVRYMDKKTRFSAMRKKLDSLLTQDPGQHIFLATDNKDVLNFFEREYNNVHSTPKWYPTSGTSMHNNPACPNRVEHGISALVDIYLLAACDSLIIDESSSFSYIASLLTDAPRSNVFNMQRGRALPPRLRHTLWLWKRKFQKKILARVLP